MDFGITGCSFQPWFTAIGPLSIFHLVIGNAMRIEESKRGNLNVSLYNSDGKELD